MKKKIRRVVRFISGLLLIVGIVTIAFILTQRAHRIEPNDPDTVGNTASNIYNGGLMCEADDGKVYFSNVYDGGSLYVMNPDETELKKLNKYYTKYINAAGDYLYFYESADGAASIAGFGGHMMGVYRSKKDGSKIKCLDKTSAGVMTLAGNYLYYQHYTNLKNEGMTLYKVSIDKKEYGMVLNEIMDPSCVYGGAIYYAGVYGDHDLRRINIGSDSASVVAKGDFWNPVLTDRNSVYYMNVMDDYRIHFMDLSTGEDRAVTEERADCFNVAGSYIYYQANNDGRDMALMRCRLDGSESEVIAQGAFTGINSTSRYVYFIPYDNQKTMYRCPVNGPAVMSEFSAARNMAISSQPE